MESGQTLQGLRQEGGDRVRGWLRRPPLVNSLGRPPPVFLPSRCLRACSPLPGAEMIW